MSLFRDLLIEKKRRRYYCELEYLESSGTQYINTGIFPTQLTKAKIEMQFTDVNYKQAVLGSNNGASGDTGWNNLFGTNENSSTAKPTYFWCQWGPSFDGPITKDTNRHTHTFERNGNSSWTYTIDNNSITITSGISTQTTPKIMYLFACNNNGTAYRQAKVKVYRCQIWNNGTLVRDFIPVLDWNMTPCMYDKVSGQLFYNQGTGSFTYGREIHPVEYLESTGTQYIDTGIYLTNNHSVEIDYQLTQAIQNRKGLFGGLSIVGGEITSRFGALLSPSNSYLEAGYGSTNVYYQLGLPDTNRHVLKQVKNELYFDGNLVYTFSTSTFTQNFSAPLMNFNFTNYNPASAKYYSSKWWNGNTIIRDYIPAIDENGVGFMFDKVSHTCFLNAGTGVFKYPAREVEYLQSSGTQYIDTGWTPVSNDLRVNFRTKSMSSPSATAICGAEKNGVIPRWVFILYGQSTDTTKTFPLTGDWNNNSNGFTFTSGSVLEIDWTTSSASTTITDSISGTTYTQTFGSTINYSNNPITLKLFQNADNQKSSIQINYYKIWDNNIIKRDFIPAFKDGVAGMLDKANNVFYSNAGTGTFSVGRIIEKRFE